MEVAVVIVGAGQSGLAVAACLNTMNISNLVLDRDDCIASLWRKRSYDRLHLHLAKNYCQLPYSPHPSTTPNFIPKAQFISYLDDYAARFNVCIKLRRNVESAEFDDEAMMWQIMVKNLSTGETEQYTARFLVVASGGDMIVLPELEGMESFGGEVVHSSQYRTGEKYEGKAVLVVGSGNSGMEIAYDLACCGARTSIVVRSPLHMVTKEILMLGMLLMKYLPMMLVNVIVLFLYYLFFGDTSKYGLQRPDKGPFYLKINSTPAYPVIDVGTFQKIKSGEIQVFPSVSSIQGDRVAFINGTFHVFDAIILATGYKSTIKEWLKSDDYLIGDDGISKQKFPNNWKGRNELYCAGLVGRGIYGSADDALKIASDIDDILKKE